MKTTKTILSILGLALASISFGQLISMHEISKDSDIYPGSIPDHFSEVLFYTADYNMEQGRLEHWVHNLPGRNFHSVSHNEYEAPLVTRSYFATNVEIIYDDKLVIEDWMTTPFESNITEVDLQIEDWMNTPFDEYLDNEVIEIEAWMTTAWI